MYCVSIIPLIPGISKDTLTYFTKRKFLLGDILECPFRNKLILGIVLECATASDNKSLLKEADYLIRKIDEGRPTKRFFSVQFIETIVSFSQLYGLRYSDVLYALVPKVFFEAYTSDLLSSPTEGASLQQLPQSSIFETSLLETQNLIKDLCLKNSGRIVVIAPTLERVKYLYTQTQDSLENVVMLHGRQAQKKQLQEIAKLAKLANKNFVLFCTPAFTALSAMPSFYIIDSYASDIYSSLQLKTYNLANFYADFCAYAKIPCIKIDALLPEPDSIDKYNHPDSYEIIDMTDSTQGSKNFWLSQSVLKSIIHTAKTGQNTLLYVSRKGLATSLVCKDCKNIVSCESCGGQKSLTEKRSVRALVCNFCNNKEQLGQDTLITCTTCGGWNIDTVGVGTQLIASILEKNGLTCFRYDSDAATSQLATENLIKKYQATPGAILVATDISPSYFTEKIANVAIISLDSRLSIPTYSSDFKVLTLLRNLSSLTDSPVLLQTRLKNYPLIQKLTQGQTIPSLKECDLICRKELNYPPYGALIEVIKKTSFSEKEVGVLQALTKTEVLFRVYRNYSLAMLKVANDITTLSIKVSEIAQNVSYTSLRVHR